VDSLTAGSLTADVGVVHQHGLDAVFSVLYTICTLDEALALRHSREAAPAGIPQLQLTAHLQNRGDVSRRHPQRLDAVFSVLYTICTLDEALANAAANLRMTARNVAAVHLRC
jgi:glycerate kinase